MKKTSKSPSKLAWSKMFRSPKKPKLSRKIVQSSKVNLNLHWDSFEDDDMSKDFDMSLKLHSEATSNYVNVHVQNAINDNLANERAELFIINKQQQLIV